MHDARSAQRSKRGTDLFGEQLRLFFSSMASSATMNDTISRLVLLENA
jgi:hypothetical protein